MADNESQSDAAEQISEIRQEFERAENAGDSSVVDEYSTDDVVAISPGHPPAVGKEASRKALDEQFGTFDVEVDYTSQEVVVGEELAFDRLTAHETHIPKDGGEPIEHTADSVWVYRQSPDGEWKQIRAIWNCRE
jgi:ketosteroid isomerase-like protein